MRLGARRVRLRALPWLLQALQAAQGAVPCIGRLCSLPPGGAAAAALRGVAAAVAALQHEAAHTLEPAAAAAAASGAAWLADDDAPVYLELAARGSAGGGATRGAAAIFVKSYTADVLVTSLYLDGRWLAALSPAGGEEQALVDTLFPSVFGRARGLSIACYAPPPTLAAGSPHLAAAYDGEREVAAVIADLAAAGVRCDAFVLPAWCFFETLSVVEAGEPVPDPDAVDEEDARHEAEEEAAAVVAAAADGAETSVDLTADGSGFAQVYVVLHGCSGGGGGGGTRDAVFRFGHWVYAGAVELPAVLTLGDVPQVLPALQRQQGRLAFLCEARASPGDAPAVATLQAFARAVALLRGELEAAQTALAALADAAVTAWVDAPWAASFLELTLEPASLPPPLRDAAVIAAKLFLADGAGLTLHVVLYDASLFCVLSDATERGTDLPLLDVAFPDVSARNRCARVLAYDDAARAALADANPGAPTPKELRVCEGRRRGITGVGCGATEALAQDAASAAPRAPRIRARARLRAEAAAARVPAVPSGKVGSGGGGSDGDIDADEWRSADARLLVTSPPGSRRSSLNGGVSPALATGGARAWHLAPLGQSLPPPWHRDGRPRLD